MSARIPLVAPPTIPPSPRTGEADAPGVERPSRCSARWPTTPASSAACAAAGSSIRAPCRLRQARARDPQVTARVARSTSGASTSRLRGGRGFGEDELRATALPGAAAWFRDDALAGPDVATELHDSARSRRHLGPRSASGSGWTSRSSWSCSPASTAASGQVANALALPPARSPRFPADPPAPGPRAHAGSCLCGAVRFEIDGPLVRSGYCHCRSCRKPADRRTPPTRRGPRGVPAPLGRHGCASPGRS